MKLNWIEKIGIFVAALLIGGFFVYSSTSGSGAAANENYHYKNDPKTLVLVELRTQSVNTPIFSPSVSTNPTIPEDDKTPEPSLTPRGLNDPFDAFGLFQDALDTTVPPRNIPEPLDTTDVSPESDTPTIDGTEAIEPDIEEPEATVQPKTNWFVNIINNIKTFFKNLSDSRPGVSMIAPAYAQSETETCRAAFDTASSAMESDEQWLGIAGASNIDTIIRQFEGVRFEPDVLYLKSRTVLTPEVISEIASTDNFIGSISMLLVSIQAPRLYYLLSPDCVSPYGPPDTKTSPAEYFEQQFEWYTNNYKPADWLKELFYSKIGIENITDVTEGDCGDDIAASLLCRFFSLDQIPSK